VITPESLMEEAHRLNLPLEKKRAIFERISSHIASACHL